MRKLIFLIAALVALGVVYWLISPLFITRRVAELLEDIGAKETIATVAQGAFVGLGAHNAQGTAKLLKSGDAYYVRFEDDFSVTNGPDLFVHFGKDGVYAPEARLGALTGNVGAQNYALPGEINPANYNEVWVWCRSFAVPFARAELR